MMFNKHYILPVINSKSLNNKEKNTVEEAKK